MTQVAFPGLTSTIATAWTFTLSHGVGPSVAIINAVPFAGYAGSIGTLRFFDGGASVSFASCIVDDATLDVGSGGQLWTVRILDRRWKWQLGSVSGRYNRRLSDGTIDPETELNARRLMELCFDSIGENADLSRVPDNVYPEVDWVYQSAAAALSSLADGLGMRVVLSSDDTVGVWPTGEGALLPNLASIRSLNFPIDLPIKPEEIRLVGAPLAFQARWRCRAVGVDIDSSVKPIDQLSYAPAGGWANGGDPDIGFEAINDCKARQLAQRTVFRWYQIDETLGDIGLPKVDRIELQPAKLDTFVDLDGKTKPRPPEVFGKHWNGDLAELTSLPNDCQNSQVQFDVDGERNIVQFSEPIYAIQGNAIVEAEVVVETACRIKDDFGQYVRYTSTRNVGGQFGEAVIRQEDVEAKTIARYDDNHNQTGQDDNAAEVADAVRFYLDAKSREYVVVQAVTAQYVGVVPVRLDGAIQQVTWSMSPGGCLTTASRNSEHDYQIQSYAEHRRVQQLRRLIEKPEPRVEPRGLFNR